MIAPATLALLLLAPPAFRVEEGVPLEAEAIASEAWVRFERLLSAEGVAPAASARSVRIALAGTGTLAPGAAAASGPGAVLLRPGLRLSGAGARALRHEIAHQILFEACPAASGDRLFHEAFAIAANGETEDWTAGEGGYLALASALELLGRARSLDTPPARRALARLLADAPSPRGHLPRAIARRFSGCEAGARWSALRPEDLADAGDAPAVDALVVLSRHTGEVLLAQGGAAAPMPFGSTLKPFLLAGARETPLLAPDRARPGWRCGGGMPARMDAATALLRSCNGWFLDWAARDPEAVAFGRWGPALVALGLSSLPADASEAIGIRPSLRISPLGLAHAYRLLAEARPDLLDVLSRNARDGTLAGLPASHALAGVAAKTGTVLDAEANPRLGWIAAVDRDVVAVMARAGRTPRTFASELAAVLGRWREPAQAPALVQVLGLVATGEVTGRCAGRGFVAGRGGPEPVPEGEVALLALARTGALVCAGGPWLVRRPGLAEPRTYAGVFSHAPAPPLPPPPPAGPAPTAREQRARRGSDLLFRTTRLVYAAGVVASEDASLRGPPHVALARVADANGRHSRHPGRPVCDTTHCQAFLGTRPASREDRAALASPIEGDAWLPFSRGGDEPWREERAAAAVEAALGPGARALAFRAGRVSFTVSEEDAAGRWEERRELPCERLRGPLKLPSCPERATSTSGGARVVFEGRGQGHGEGLDVEWARRSGLAADEILARSYGAAVRGR